MDDLEDYLIKKDKQHMQTIQKCGMAQAYISIERDRVTKYLGGLSGDAVASPDFIRSFSNEMTRIVHMLAIE